MKRNYKRLRLLVLKILLVVSSCSGIAIARPGLEVRAIQKKRYSFAPPGSGLLLAAASSRSA
ncbi:MAG: hypothetical protein KME12_17180 [Trichocoleus desertorum ATA4-8-CV12]|nr:hypothetical protein [Trichocoleus desertorum ATA4-8-CV12]